MLDSSSGSVPACLCLRYPVISSMEFFIRQRQQNKLVSRLYFLPRIQYGMLQDGLLARLRPRSDIRLAWVVAVFTYRVKRSEVTANAIRCAKLYQSIKAYYDRTGVTDRLPKLLPTMLREEDRGKIKFPKVKGQSR